MAKGFKRNKLNYLYRKRKDMIDNTGDWGDFTSQEDSTPAFLAAAPHPATTGSRVGQMVLQSYGQGTPTVTYAATGEDTRYTSDYESVYRPFYGSKNEPVWTGGRVVENLLTYSNTFSNAAWVKSNVTESSGTITASAGNGTLLQTVTGTFANGVFSCTLTRVTGSGNIDITCDSGGTWTTVSVTTTATRFSVASSTMSNETVGIRIVTSGDEVLIENAQFEVTSGKSDTSTPSEYVATTTASAKKVFNTENKYAVRSNVVYDDGEYVTNGGFDTDLSGWSDYGGVTTWLNDGTIQLEGDGNAYCGFGRVIETIAGVSYEVAYTIVSVDADRNGGIRVGTDFVGQNNLLDENQTLGVTGEFSHIFTATGSTTYITPRLATTSTGTIVYDNVSVKRINSGGRIDTELVSNGGIGYYDSVTETYKYRFLDTTGWTGSGATLSVNGSDELVVTNSGAAAGEARTTITTIPGRKYRIKYSHTGGTGTNHQFEVGTSAGASDLYDSGQLAAGDRQATFIATGTTTHVSLITDSTTSGHTSTWEFISIAQESAFLSYSPAATNLITDSRDLTGWTESGTPVDTYDQVGITGEPNTATYIEDDDGAALEYVELSTTVAAATNTVAARFYVKKDADTSRFPMIGFSFDPGGVGANYQLNTSTGATTASSGFSNDASAAVTVHQEGDWWIVTISCTNVSSRTTCIAFVVPADGTVFGTRSTAATGSCIVGQVEVYDNTTIEEVQYRPPIFTSAGSASHDRIVYQFDLANHSDTQGLWFVEWIPGYTNATLAAQESILSLRGGLAQSILFDHTTDGNLRSADGSTFTDVTESWSALDENNLCITYGSSLFGIGANGTFDATVPAYDGAFVTATGITIGGAVYPAGFRNIQYWNLPYAAAVTKGTELME